MTDKALEYCGRGIVQYLNGDMDKFRYYVNKAMAMHRATLCTCGEIPIPCRYGRVPAELCTSCGKLWINGEMVRKCLIGRKTA
jgi:hypothetical protein